MTSHDKYRLRWTRVSISAAVALLVCASMADKARGIPIALSTSGDWGTAGNWTPAQEPTGVDDVTVGGGLTADVTLAGEAASTLTLSDTGAGTLNVNGGDLAVGSISDGGAGVSTINLNSDTLAADNTNITVDNFNVNPVPTATFTYNRSGGTLQVDTNLQLGGDLSSNSNFKGNITQTGGSVIVNGALLFGGAASTEGGTYDLNNGTLTVNGDVIEGGAGAPNSNVDTAQLYVDQPGALTVTGDITVQSFRVADNQAGSYTVPSTQTVTTTGTLLVGRAQTGTLTVDGGAIVAANSTVGDTTNSDGSTLTLQNSATANINGAFDIGDLANGDGTVDVLSGSTLVVTGTTQVGDAGSGALNLSSGTGHSFAAVVLGNANNANSDGSMTVDVGGGNTVTVSGLFQVGDNGKGTLTLDSGSLTVNNGLIVADTANAVGARAAVATVNGGTLTVTSQTQVGDTGDGTLELLGGTGHSFAAIVIGDDNNAATDGTMTVNVGSGNTVSASGLVQVGDAGKGTFELISGTFTATAGFDLASTTTASGAQAAQMTIGTLGGSGTADPILNVSGANFETANVGTGTVTMHNGTFNQTTNNLILGQGATADATFILNDGLIDLENQLRVGNTGKGLFTQNGGTVNVGTILDIANVNDVNSDGTYRMTGGTLNAGDRTASNVLIGNSSNASASALMEIIDGTVNVSASIRIADNGANSSGSLIVGVGTTSPTVNLNVAVGAAAATNGNFEAADNGTGIFELKSGTVTINRSNWITGQATTSDATVTIGGFASPALLDIVSTNSGDWNTNNGDGDVTVLDNGTINVNRHLQLGSNASEGGLVLLIDGGAVNVGATNASGDVAYRGGGVRDEITFRDGIFTVADDFFMDQGTGSLIVDSSAAGTGFSGCGVSGFCISGNYNQNAASTLTYELDAGTVSPIQVTGTVNPGGGTLAFDFSGSGITDAFATGDILLLANAGADAISGTFAGRPELSGVINFGSSAYQLTYMYDADSGMITPTGNDLALVAVPEPGSLGLIALALAALACGGAGRRRRRS